MVSDLLLASNEWSPTALKPYVEERADRMRRLRFSTAMLITLRGESTLEARERRRRARQRMRASPELALWFRAGGGRPGCGACFGVRRSRARALVRAGVAGFGPALDRCEVALYLQLSGEIEVAVSDGETRVFGAGTVILGEDVSGKGHVTRVPAARGDTRSHCTTRLKRWFRRRISEVSR